MKVPVILQEQEIIVQWARKMKQKHISLNTIVKLLSDSKESKQHKNDEGYIKAREAYYRFNNGWTDAVLQAVMMECYILENDFKENDVVTNGLLVGVAKDIDYNRRNFTLCSSTDGELVVERYLEIHEFSKIGRV